jgi:hypothetical protein
LTAQRAGGGDPWQRPASLSTQEDPVESLSPFAHRSTNDARVHVSGTKLSPAEIALCYLVILPFAAAFVFVGCVLLTLAWPS